MVSNPSVGVIFSCLSSLVILLSIRNILMICYHDTLIQFHETLQWFAITYFIQLYLLWVILFKRLSIVFAPTVYALSKATLTIFHTIFIIAPTMLIAFIIFHLTSNKYEHIHSIVNVTLILFIMFMCIIFPLILSGLFIYKLMKLFKDRANDYESVNNRLIVAMTKNTNLSVISISSSLLTTISFVTLVSIASWMVLLDVFINFMCIMLSYSWFQNIYLSMCKPIDKQWKKCCMNLYTKEITKKTYTKVDVQKIMDTECTTLTLKPNGSLIQGEETHCIKPLTKTTLV
eukprot:511039_1